MHSQIEIGSSHSPVAGCPLAKPEPSGVMVIILGYGVWLGWGWTPPGRHCPGPGLSTGADAYNARMTAIARSINLDTVIAGTSTSTFLSRKPSRIRPPQRGDRQDGRYSP